MSDIRIIPEGKLEELVKPIFDGLQDLKKRIEKLEKIHGSYYDPKNKK